jgi:hypothetical protein
MIETATIGPLTSKEVNSKVQEAEADMRRRMRGLASAVKNLHEMDEWNMASKESTVPWGQLTAAQSATGGMHQVGHIGLSPNVYTNNSPYQTLTTTGTGVNILGSSATDYNMKVEQSGQIDIKGEKADIRINGKSMNKWMEQVEQRLNILTPNPELEKEWDDLRRLGERYRKLEKKCQEKAKMWEALKKLPKPKL